MKPGLRIPVLFYAILEIPYPKRLVPRRSGFERQAMFILECAYLSANQWLLRICSAMARARWRAMSTNSSFVAS